MSRTASKLSDSVRRAREGRGTEQGEAAAETPAENSAEAPEETPAETADESPEPRQAASPARGSRDSSREERPRPRIIPSRRVWPD